jgi:RNase adaptor protein for sRNA GlmZ degradation
MNGVSYAAIVTGASLNGASIALFTLQSMHLATVDLLPAGWILLLMAIACYFVSYVWPND